LKVLQFPCWNVSVPALSLMPAGTDADVPTSLQRSSSPPKMASSESSLWFTAAGGASVGAGGGTSCMEHTYFTYGKLGPEWLESFPEKHTCALGCMNDTSGLHTLSRHGMSADMHISTCYGNPLGFSAAQSQVHQGVLCHVSRKADVGSSAVTLLSSISQQEHSPSQMYAVPLQKVRLDSALALRDNC